MDRRYPAGRFEGPHRPLTSEERLQHIAELERIPGQVRNLAEGLSAQQLTRSYRPGGWTAGQLVHHLADSHLNGFLRFKLALTEEKPLVKSYEQDRWAETVDAKEAPLADSLKLLEALHSRWVILLRSLREEDFSRTFQHPEWGQRDLDFLLALYSWHGRHHLGHLRLIAQESD